MAQDATLEAASESRETKWLIALFKSMTKTVTKMVLPLRHNFQLA